MTDQLDAIPAIDTGSVISTDGTTIGYYQVGSGTPLVIVHGSISTAEHWLPLAAELASDHAVYIFDRRGRGLSGNADTYTIGTEAADITAVLDRAAADTGATPTLLGHSYGAICTLEAVRLGADISSLVLYEPPLPVDGPVAGAHLADYAAAVAADDGDKAIRIAAQHFLRLAPEETEALAATPLWPVFTGLAPTWTRELAEIDATDSKVSEYGDLPVRTLLLVGGVSPSHLVGASAILKSALPDSSETVLPDQGHFAHMLDPKGVAAAVRSFTHG